MPESRPEPDPTGRPAPSTPATPARPGEGGGSGHDHDLPRDHHPADARSPEEYTETPGSHRKGRHGPATDVGA